MQLDIFWAGSDALMSLFTLFNAENPKTLSHILLLRQGNAYNHIHNIRCYSRIQRDLDFCQYTTSQSNWQRSSFLGSRQNIRHMYRGRLNFDCQDANRKQSCSFAISSIILFIRRYFCQTMDKKSYRTMCPVTLKIYRTF